MHRVRDLDGAKTPAPRYSENQTCVNTTQHVVMRQLQLATQNNPKRHHHFFSLQMDAPRPQLTR